MELKTLPRTILGKKVKALRKTGFVPAELYGHGKENIHIQIAKKEFEKLYKEAGEHTIIHVEAEGKKIPALIVSVQKNPTTDEYLSVDLHEVRMDEEIRTHVPIEFVGEAPGVKKGLMLIKVLATLEIEALPTNLPPKIEVSLEELGNEGDTIHVGELTLPKGVKVLVQPETVVVTLTEHKEEKFEEAPVPVPAPVTEVAPAPEGEGKKKEE